MNWKTLAKISAQVIASVLFTVLCVFAVGHFWSFYGILVLMAVCGIGIVIITIAALYKLENKQ